MKKLIYCLFEGRHELPENQGAIYANFDFASMKAESKLMTAAHGHPDWKQSGMTIENYILYSFKEGECNLTVYVTGLTPALTQLISLLLPFCDSGKNVFHLMHYNRETHSFISQQMGKYSGDWTFDEETMSPTLYEDSFLHCGRFSSKDEVEIPYFE